MKEVLLCNIRLVSGSCCIIEKNSFAKIQANNHQLENVFWIAKIGLLSRRKGHQNCKKCWASDDSVFPTTSDKWDNSSKMTEGQPINFDKT